MECRWKDIEFDERGWRKCQCVRCERKTGFTPHEHHQIHARCSALPLWKELGHWIAFLLGVFGLDQPTWNRILRWLGFVNPCGCDKRIAKMNSAGEYAVALAVKFLAWFKR